MAIEINSRQIAQNDSGISDDAWSWVATAANRVAHEAAQGVCSAAGLRLLQAAVRTAVGNSPEATIPRPLYGDSDSVSQVGATGSGQQLTERERQVLVAIADGKSNEDIGRQLFLAEDTVKTHARRMFRKIGAVNRAHAVAIAFRRGMLT